MLFSVYETTSKTVDGGEKKWCDNFDGFTSNQSTYVGARWFSENVSLI